MGLRLVLGDSGGFKEVGFTLHWVPSEGRWEGFACKAALGKAGGPGMPLGGRGGPEGLSRADQGEGAAEAPSLWGGVPVSRFWEL